MPSKKIAPRYDVDINIMASIFGSQQKSKYTSIDASLTGLAMRAQEHEVPFQIGTLVEIRIPFSKEGDEKMQYLDMMGKVVRVETDLSNPELGKSMCGIHLVNVTNSELQVWKALINNFREKLHEADVNSNQFTKILRAG